MTNSNTGNSDLGSAIARSIDISERRIAALLTNREDKIGPNGSPAWRDALDESRMVRLYARLHGCEA